MLRGNLVALITPMDRHGNVDYPSLAHLVEYHVASGTHGLVVMGTTGESATFDHQEQLQVVEKCLHYAAGRLPIVAGCGSNNTRHAITLARALMSLGIDYGLSVTPYYNKPTQEGLYRHFAAIGEASGLAQILYNVPGRTGCDLRSETVARLAHQFGICGLKDATGELARLPTLRSQCGEAFALYSGDDATACEFMLKGGDGVISVTSNVAASEMSQLCRAALMLNQVVSDYDQQVNHRASTTTNGRLAMSLGVDDNGLTAWLVDATFDETWQRLNTLLPKLNFEIASKTDTTTLTARLTHECFGIYSIR